MAEFEKEDAARIAMAIVRLEELGVPATIISELYLWLAKRIIES